MDFSETASKVAALVRFLLFTKVVVPNLSNLLPERQQLEQGKESCSAQPGDNEL